MWSKGDLRGGELAHGGWRCGKSRQSGDQWAWSQVRRALAPEASTEQGRERARPDCSSCSGGSIWTVTTVAQNYMQLHVASQINTGLKVLHLSHKSGY